MFRNTVQEGVDAFMQDVGQQAAVFVSRVPARKIVIDPAQFVYCFSRGKVLRDGLDRRGEFRKSPFRKPLPEIGLRIGFPTSLSV
jgi:hypothetical protein